MIEDLDLNKDNLVTDSFLSLLANTLESYNEDLKKTDLELDSKSKILSQINEAYSMYYNLKTASLESDISQSTILLKNLEDQLTLIGNSFNDKINQIDETFETKENEISNAFNAELQNITQTFQTKENDINTQFNNKFDEINQMLQDGTFDGLSAYELASQNGYQGTVQQWIESLKSTLDYNDLDNKPNVSDLDDYEEGTFVATLVPSNNSFFPTANTATFKYIKMGNLVFIQGIAVMLTPSSLMSYASDNINHSLEIFGLPFVISFGSVVASVGISKGIATPSGYLSGYGASNTDKLVFFNSKNNGGDRLSPVLSESSSIYIYLSMTYTIN